MFNIIVIAIEIGVQYTPPIASYKLLLYGYENNSGKNMPECKLRDKFDRMSELIY
jgi:hypothetical protein